MPFDAFDVSLQLVRAVMPLLERIAMHDPDLARQAKKALTSVPLNLGEGRRRKGRDRAYHFGVAGGSTGEVVAALLTAEAAGYLEQPAIAPALGFADRILAMTWRLTH